MSSRFTPLAPSATTARPAQTQAAQAPQSTSIAASVESSYVDVIMRQSSQITDLQKSNQFLNEAISRQAAIVSQLTDDKQKLEAKLVESEKKFSNVQEAFGNSVNQSFQYQRVITEMVKECDALRKHIEDLEKKLAAKNEASEKAASIISAALSAKFPQSGNGFAAAATNTTTLSSSNTDQNMASFVKIPDEPHVSTVTSYGRSIFDSQEKPNFSFKCPPSRARPSLLPDYESKNANSQPKSTVPSQGSQFAVADQQNTKRSDRERSPLSNAEADASRPFLLSAPPTTNKSLLTDNVLLYPFITQGFSKRILNLEHIRILKLFETQADHALVNDAYNKFVKAFSNVLNAEGSLELSEQMVTYIAEHAKKWRILTQDAYRIQYLVFELTRLVMATLQNFTVFDEFEVDSSKKLAQAQILKIQTRMRSL